MLSYNPRPKHFWTSKLSLTSCSASIYRVHIPYNHSTHKIFSVGCLYQSLLGDGSQHRSLFPCSHSYRLATTHCSNCRLPTQLTLSVSVLLLAFRQGTPQKTPFLCCCFQLLPCTYVYACQRSYYSVTTVVYLLISRSLPRNGSICQNM
jgi:hypothetical protein